MKNTLIFLEKCLAIWIVLLIGQVIGGLAAATASHLTQPASDGGPFTAQQAMLVVMAAHALVFSALASQLRWNGWRKAAALFAVYYVVGTALNTVEGLFFGSFVKLSAQALLLLAAGDLIKAALASVVAMLLWKNGSEAAPETFGGLVWKLPLLVPIYIVFYFGAGALIAWQGAAVRAYYGQGLQINTGLLALAQVGRGAIWAATALLLAKGLTGARLTRGLLTGLAFAVFMAMALLYPNGFMPWDVRKFHLMEITSSNFLYGLLATLILMAGSKPKSAT